MKFKLVLTEYKLIVFRSSIKRHDVVLTLDVVDVNYPEQLKLFLSKQRLSICTLYFDISDEEMFLEYVPRISGVHRNTVIHNRRDTYLDDKYLSCVIEDRRYKSTSERRIMVTGIRAKGLVGTVVSAINQAGVGLQGIYSVAWFRDVSLALSNRDSELVLSVYSPDGETWRLSVFHQNFLLISRSIELIESSVIDFLQREIGDTLRFAKQKSRSGNEYKISLTLDVPEKLHKELEHTTLLSDCRQEIIPAQENLNLYQKIVQSWKPHKQLNYAGKKEKENYSAIRNSRATVFGAMVFCVGGSNICYSYGVNAWHSLEQLDQIEVQIHRETKILENLDAKLHTYPDTPENMSSTTKLFRGIELIQNHRRIIAVLSNALNKFGSIHIHSLSWQKLPMSNMNITESGMSQRDNFSVSEVDVVNAQFEIRSEQGNDSTREKFTQQLVNEGLNVLTPAKPVDAAIHDKGVISLVSENTQALGSLFSLRMTWQGDH